MQIPLATESRASHRVMWQKFKPLLDSRRIPNAILFVGPQHSNILQFGNQLVAALLCQSASVCGLCHDCHMLSEGTHPDLVYIIPEGVDKAIKIDQIRSIQQDVYQTPKFGDYRVVVINPADRMNVAAANALLKVLEEPPDHTVFILLAEQIDSMLPTILSRCQRFVFIEDDTQVYLELGKLYPDETMRAKLYQNGKEIINSLCDLIEGNESPCAISAKWAEYTLDDLLWWLYLVNAQAIKSQLYNKTIAQCGPFSEVMSRFIQGLHPYNLFILNDKICALRDKINHNVTINQQLAIDDLLLDYAGTING